MTHIKNTLRAANEAHQAEWDPDDRITLAYRGNEMAGEVGEACNVIKKLERERLGIAGSRATVDQLAEELADVVICADLIAMHADIDLMGEAVPAKFNATSEKTGLRTRLAEPHVLHWRPTHRHRKGGRYYREVARGLIEATLDRCVIYEDAEHTLWVRPAAEFDDGRFTPLKAANEHRHAEPGRRLMPKAEDTPHDR